MGDYTSDSSDSDNQHTNKSLDFSYAYLDSDTLFNNLEVFSETEKSSTNDTEALLLHHNQLSTLPLNINKFQNLKLLDISSNGLKELPEVLISCPLTSLIARNNNLDNDSFPKSFSLLNNLKELNLSGNNLTCFPEQVLELSKLKYLYLGGNQIQEIPKDIWKLTWLQILYMGGNRLVEVPASVGQLRFLHGLILSDNMIESIPASIANLTNLKSLLLHKNKLKALPTEIIALKFLTELSLRDNPLVVRFVSHMTLNPSSLLEAAGRTIKTFNILYSPEDLPLHLRRYLDSAHQCVNPKCEGVYFDNHVEHIKFVDFCGKFRVPLLQYLCSPKCIMGDNCKRSGNCDHFLMKKVLLG
uniref:Disease resistance R13L4/SHOC-2-like LRR domain-containing protein n=1 Tax=Timema monikensis TaxID=170555 RepID=A0A7R9DWY7_9NEOP|nr:unnamed protein product [Timema monikensis]